MAGKDRAREKSAQMRAEQALSETRRRTLVFAATTVAGVAVVGGLTWLGLRSSASAGEIDGMSTYSELTSNHVTGSVAYAQTPPVGGDHSGQWQNCGWYDETVANENAVHSMEHGAAWITYRSQLTPKQRAVLRSKLAGRAYVLASPAESLPSAVVASAWGAQVTLSGPDDPRLEEFLTRYANSRTAPEPGGECTGGVGTPQ